MLYIKDIKPSLNMQADSIRQTVYVTLLYIFIGIYCYVSYTHTTRKHFMYFLKCYIFTSHLILFTS